MSELLRRLVETIKEYEQEKNDEIRDLECQIKFLQKERSLIIQRLEEGNVELVKEYFNIHCGVEQSGSSRGS